MCRYKSLGVLLLITKFGMALPTLAIPNLVYTPGVKKIAINDIDVRGAIINSGKFKIVEAPKNFNISAINTSGPGTDLNQVPNSITQNQSIESLALESANKNTITVNDTGNGTILQDNLNYILLGQVLAIDETNDLYPIKNTDKFTVTHTISVTVSYKLLRIKDKASVAAFNAYGTTSQTKFITDGENPQLVSFNRPMMTRDVSKDLANDVVTQLLNQVQTTNRIEQNDHPVVTDVKTYSD